jgi:hypothetical protein
VATVLAYFFALFITVVAHMRCQPDILSLTVYSVAWFGRPHSGGVTLQKQGSQSFGTSSSSPIPENDSWTRYLDDLEHASVRKLQNCTDSGLAPWAQSMNIRRGVDNPFTKQENNTSARSSFVGGSPTPPPLPIKAQTNGPPDKSRFIEKFRESLTISRSESPAQFVLRSSSRVAPFPPRVDDHDLPIPLPRMSEWIRACDEGDQHADDPIFSVNRDG